MRVNTSFGALEVPISVPAIDKGKSQNADDSVGKDGRAGSDVSFLKGVHHHKDIRDVLESRGMETSFVINPTTGVAQMVIVESGTGREVLKVPADSSLHQALSARG